MFFLISLLYLLFFSVAAASKIDPTDLFTTLSAIDNFANENRASMAKEICTLNNYPKSGKYVISRPVGICNESMLQHFKRNIAIYKIYEKKWSNLAVEVQDKLNILGTPQNDFNNLSPEQLSEIMEWKTERYLSVLRLKKETDNLPKMILNNQFEKIRVPRSSTQPKKLSNRHIAWY